MGKRFRTCDLSQPFLLPPSLQDWLAEDHLARFIADVAEQLDLSAIYASHERRDGRGKAAYHPLLMTRLLLYAYCVGKPSSRAIEKATHEDVAFRYLAANQHPDHDTIAAFRQQHLERLAGLFIEVLALCRKAGMVKLGHVALDGTKVRAQASKRRNLSYRQMEKQEEELRERVRQMLEQAAQVDAAEDARYGKGRRGDELPEELATTKKRLAKLREVKRQMEQEARDKAAQAEKERAAAGGKPRHEAEKKRWYRAKKNSASPAGRRNLSDPDSRLMKDSASGGFVQGFNAQAVVDGQRQIIVAAEVTEQPTDKMQLGVMVKQTKRNLRAKPLRLTADAGYWSEDELQRPELKGIDVVVPPDSQAKLDQPLARNAPRSEMAERMRTRLRDPAEQALYAMRKAIVEPVFGQIKERRGFRRFSLRGLAPVRAEWALICLTHNLLKLHRHRMAEATV